MTSEIDNAIARIQTIALSLQSVTIKSAPAYPTENADPFPMCASYVGSGEFYSDNSASLHNFPVVSVEFHVSRVNFQQMVQQINAIAYEFPRRLAGDPTLSGTVTTIVMTPDNRIPYTVRPFEWGKVTSQAITFSIPLKFKQSPLTTS